MTGMVFSFRKDLTVFGVYEIIRFND